MAKVMMIFASEQRGTSSDALRALGITSHVGGWYVFDDVQHDNSGRLTQLTRGDDVYIVPTQHILMVRIQGVSE